MDIPTKENKIKFIKGSNEAKDHMQKIRAFKKVKVCSEENCNENKKPLRIFKKIN